MGSGKGKEEGIENKKGREGKGGRGNCFIVSGRIDAPVLNKQKGWHLQSFIITSAF